MSSLGDLIVTHGPWTPGRGAEQIDIELRLALYDGADLNALRDELIELRARCTPEPDPCTAEAWSWEHFNDEQADGYWITCDVRGAHVEHEDEHTGLTWRTEPGS